METEADQTLQSGRQIDSEITEIGNANSKAEDEYKLLKNTLKLLPEANKNLEELRVRPSLSVNCSQLMMRRVLCRKSARRVPSAC